MGFIPVQPQKTREMRERYRKARRKQQVQFTLLGCAVLLAVGLVSLVSWLLRRPPGVRPQRPVAGRRSAVVTTELPKVVGEKLFKQAPWQFEVDGQGFYYFADSRHSLGTHPNYRCDTMGAEVAQGGRPRWEVKGDFALQHSENGQGVDWADGTLVGLTQRLTDKQLDLTGWDAAKGEQRWTAHISQATEGQLVAQGQSVLLTYLSTKDGKFRLASWNSGTGKWGWTKELPLKRLKREFRTPEGLAKFTRHDTNYAVVYTCGNIIGIFDPLTGKQRQEWGASGQIIETLVVDKSQTAYILIQGNAQANYSLVAVPFNGATPRTVLNLQTADARVFYLATQGWMLTCCRESKGTASVLRVRCQPLDNPGAQFVHDLPGGNAFCGAALGGDSSSFLLGLTDSAESQGGATSFVIVDPVRGEVTAAGSPARPVLSIVPFKDDNLLGVADGGVLYRFDPGKQRFLNFRKLRYPQVFIRQSDDRTTLLVCSTTEQYFNDAQGGALEAADGKESKTPAAVPLQALVIQ
jgi:hypothetical protein